MCLKLLQTLTPLFTPGYVCTFAQKLKVETNPLSSRTGVSSLPNKSQPLYSKLGQTPTNSRIPTRMGHRFAPPPPEAESAHQSPTWHSSEKKYSTPNARHSIFKNIFIFRSSVVFFLGKKRVSTRQFRPWRSALAPWRTNRDWRTSLVFILFFSPPCQSAKIWGI